MREQIRRQVESAIIAFEEAASFAERVRHCKSAYLVEKVVIEMWEFDFRSISYLFP